MSGYGHYSIFAEEGDIIPFKFIESMRFIGLPEDETVDKLKGDVSVSIRTISGKEYTISMNALQKAVGGRVGGNDLARAIYDKWLWIHKPN